MNRNLIRRVSINQIKEEEEDFKEEEEFKEESFKEVVGFQKEIEVEDT